MVAILRLFIGLEINNLAQASIVEPVVTTSSTKRISLPFNLSSFKGETPKTSLTFKIL